MLRLEEKGTFWIRDADGQLISGQTKTDHVMHFWTLIHDGERIRLDRVWLSDRDVTDLAEKTQPPVVTEWQGSSASNPKTDS